MRQLRLVGVADDGGSLLLETPTGEAFRLPLDERVRAACRGDLTRLGQIEIELDNPLRPREIQARVRAGESAEQVAASSGMPLDRVLRFASPMLQERERVVAQARATRLHAKRPETLAELVEERLVGRGTDAATLRWDAWRREDGRWTVRLSWRHAAEHSATWVFQLARRMLQPDDPAAEQLSAEEFHARTITAVTPLAAAARVSGRPGGASAHPAGTGGARPPRDRPARGVEARAGRGGYSAPPRLPGTDAPGTDPSGAAGRGRPAARGADRPGAGAGGGQPSGLAADRPGAVGGTPPGLADPAPPARAGGAGRAGRTGGRRVGAGSAGTPDADPAAADGSTEAAAGGGPARTAAGDGDRTATASDGHATDRAAAGGARADPAAGRSGSAADAPSGSQSGRRPPRADGGSEDAAAQPRRIAAGGESDLRAETDEDRARRTSVPSWDDILLGVRRRH